MMALVWFWIVLGGLGFGFALAVQMRIMIALVLRRALQAWRDGFEHRAAADSVIVNAASQEDASGDQAHLLGVQHLRTTYPMPLSHLRAARRASYLLPPLMLVWLALGRFGLGVI